MSLMSQRLFGLCYLSPSVLSISGTVSGRIPSTALRGHQIHTRIYDEIHDEVFWARFRAGIRKAFPRLSREGCHTAYGLVYLSVVTPCRVGYDPNVLSVSRAVGMSLKFVRDIMRKHFINGGR